MFILSPQVTKSTGRYSTVKDRQKMWYIFLSRQKLGYVANEQCDAMSHLKPRVSQYFMVQFHRHFYRNNDSVHINKEENRWYDDEHWIGCLLCETDMI